MLCYHNTIESITLHRSQKNCNRHHYHRRYYRSMMNTLFVSLLLLQALLLLSQLPLFCHGFVSLSSSSRQQHQHQHQHQHALLLVVDDSNTEIRADIERMREEASQRLDILNQRFKEVETIRAASEASTTEESLTEIATEFDRDMKELSSSSSSSSSSTTAATRSSPSSSSSSSTRRTTAAELYPAKLSGASTTRTQSHSTNEQQQQPQSQIHHDPLKLLDETRWRMMLNVERMPGTWMPKTWGASGDTIKMKVEVEFTSDPLVEEHDDFFDSHPNNFQKDYAGTKVLRVVNNEACMAPSKLSEGERKLKVTNGGWKIMQGFGPSKTDVLRYYFTVEEEDIHHRGSDISLPQGRVYGACGYFPITKNTSKKDMYATELRHLETQFHALKEGRKENKKDQLTIFIHNMKLMKQQLEVQDKMHQTRRLLEQEERRHPSMHSDTLRLSQDQLVGLTKEGGICCKKIKGFGKQEYHILGNFVVASMENRDHADYQEALDQLRP